MRADIWDAWVQRLEDPDSKQMIGRLRSVQPPFTDPDDPMCCLGHLGEVCVGKIPGLKWDMDRLEYGDQVSRSLLPRRLASMLGNNRANGDFALPITIGEACKEVGFDLKEDLKDDVIVNPEDAGDPSLEPEEMATLAGLNDLGLSLAQIAQLVRKYIPREENV